MKAQLSVCLSLLCCALTVSAAPSPAPTNDPAAEPVATRQVIPAKTAKRDVPPERMQQVYDEVKTPFKYGIVIRGEENQFVDCPSIFQQNGQWYMVYVGITQKVGYETFLARSADLLHWDKLGKIMSFRPEGWDKAQVDGGIALCDPTWGGSSELQSYDGKFWMSYIGGARKGYETDPLSLGVAWCKDARYFEKLTLYKSQVIWDKEKTLGHPFVMYYNAKTKSGYERIGMAVSDDMTHWQRYGDEPVIDNGKGISGDPQIVKIGDVWVMFYFGFQWKPGVKGAFDTFACSYDLVHWTKWEGEPQVKPSEPWDKPHAHKPWVIKHEGVVYHFYCAVGNEGRVIALATSKDLKQEDKK